jgi:hypothetical protein
VVTDNNVDINWRSKGNQLMPEELDENYLQMLVVYQLLITDCVCDTSARCQRCRLLDSARTHWTTNYNKATALHHKETNHD